MLSIGVIVVSVLILGIWILIEVKRMRHKFFAIFLILLILFTYVSFSITMKNNDVNLKTIDGLTKATKLYFLWLGSAFGNMKSITTNAVKMDWSAQQISPQTNSTQVQ
jgi:hypothetical protein